MVNEFLTNDDKRALAEFLGVAWHEPTGVHSMCICGVTNVVRCIRYKNPKFDNPTVILQLLDKLTEKNIEYKLLSYKMAGHNVHELRIHDGLGYGCSSIRNAVCKSISEYLKGR